MNMNNNPTLEQLRDLLRKGDDHAGHHVLWVKKDGTVVLTQLEKGPRSKLPTYEHLDMQMRYGTFPVGYEYVGEEAAKEDWWIPLLFENMVANWAKCKGTSGITDVDNDTVAPDGYPVDAEEAAWLRKAREETRRLKQERQKRQPRPLPHSYE